MIILEHIIDCILELNFCLGVDLEHTCTISKKIHFFIQFMSLNGGQKIRFTILVPFSSFTYLLFTEEVSVKLSQTFLNQCFNL